MDKAVILIPSLSFPPARVWPEEIIVEPSRLATGNWGEPEGDIWAAYSADTFPKIKTFVYEGQLFTNSGGCEYWVTCYPLIPEADYNGPESKKCTWEGKAVVFGGQEYKLGRKVTFTARERTLEEGIDYLRRVYALGGYFAAGKTYREVLLAFAERDQIPPWEKSAIETELARADLAQTQDEMLDYIQKQSSGSQDCMQLILPGL